MLVEAHAQMTIFVDLPIHKRQGQQIRSRFSNEIGDFNSEVTELKLLSDTLYSSLALLKHIKTIIAVAINYQLIAIISKQLLIVGF